MSIILEMSKTVKWRFGKVAFIRRMLELSRLLSMEEISLSYDDSNSLSEVTYPRIIITTTTAPPLLGPTDIIANRTIKHVRHS